VAALARQITAADRAGIDRAELRLIATGRPLPIEQPAAALAYRLIDAMGDRPASVPVQPPKAAAPRPYEPCSLAALQRHKSARVRISGRTASARSLTPSTIPGGQDGASIQVALSIWPMRPLVQSTAAATSSRTSRPVAASS